MQITITARHLSLSSAATEDFKARIAPLGRFDDSIRYIDVVCKKEHDKAIMEWKIGFESGNPLVLHCEEDTMKNAIDTLTDKAEKNLKRHKDKASSIGHEKITEMVEDI